MLVSIVAGARPNFMKIAPIIRAIDRVRGGGADIAYRLVHTGQHFDAKMSGEFFEQLGIPEPDINLAAGGGSQAEQTAAVMTSFERELENNRPDVVLVVGDVTSTMACAVTAAKLCVPVVHVEAGIRSGDRTMPEEINRIVTDSVCEQFFTTSVSAGNLLTAAGVDPSRIHFVGNTMIDTLLYNIDRLRKPDVWDAAGLEPQEYLLLTLHRPSNVDDPGKLSDLLRSILDSADGQKVVFPVHPRTRKVLDLIEFTDDRMVIVDPMGYLEFIFLLRSAHAVITDSGGITEEATVLDVPCITLRDSTERPETVAIGTNVLAGTDPRNIAPHLARLASGEWKKGSIPELWDGQTSGRIVDILLRIYGERVAEQEHNVLAISK